MVQFLQGGTELLNKDDQVMCLSSVSVKRALSRINTLKVVGPDNIPGSVLKDCVEEVKGVIKDILTPPLVRLLSPLAL